MSPASTQNIKIVWSKIVLISTNLKSIEYPNAWVSPSQIETQIDISGSKNRTVSTSDWRCWAINVCYGCFYRMLLILIHLYYSAAIFEFVSWNGHERYRYEYGNRRDAQTNTTFFTSTETTSPIFASAGEITCNAFYSEQTI